VLTGGFCSPEKVTFPTCSSVNITQAQHVRFNVRVERDNTLNAEAVSLLELSVL